MTQIFVNTDQSYNVVVGRNILKRAEPFLAKANKVAVISSDALSNISYQVMRMVSGFGKTVLRLNVPEGEHAKSATVAAKCWQELANSSFTRSDLIIGVGGGATTDLAGFIAATYLRGIDYISVPTTVLAAADAAVGGKTGIDLEQGKNLVGAFYEPKIVLSDLTFFSSLPQREISCGMAEILKAGFVKEKIILERILENPYRALNVSSETFEELLSVAIAFKAEVVAGDLKERTSQGDQLGRELLNYGHTMGHAIERYENYSMRHGEAVALGMIFAAELAHRCFGLDRRIVDLHRMLVRSLNLPTSYSAAPFEKLRDLMAIDKKTRGNTLRFVALRDIAKPAILVNPPEGALFASYQALKR